jgi:hypothetical protein
MPRSQHPEALIRGAILPVRLKVTPRSQNASDLPRFAEEDLDPLLPRRPSFDPGAREPIDADEADGRPLGIGRRVQMGKVRGQPGGLSRTEGFPRQAGEAHQATLTDGEGCWHRNTPETCLRIEPAIEVERDGGEPVGRGKLSHHPLPILWRTLFRHPVPPNPSDLRGCP